MRTLAYRFNGEERADLLSRIVKDKPIGIKLGKLISDLSNDPDQLAQLCSSRNVRLRKWGAANANTREEDKVVAALLGL